ncbi:hypothetical protein [Ralstonia mannitolilytica]|uniref:hypothetical protein n=1 Tax=Ralstonia mannitolilytica TaxID=105219 RepID=UPI000CEDC53A|nr:hypothetical protein [Ralstonia mannitolilytica]
MTPEREAQMREAFEKEMGSYLAKLRGPHCMALSTKLSGEYAYLETEIAWRSWRAALRAQADARPVGEWVKHHRWNVPHLKWAKGYEAKIGDKLYTHPEASVLGLSERERYLIDKAAERLREADFIDEASAVRAILTRASAATVAGPSDGRIKHETGGRMVSHVTTPAGMRVRYESELGVTHIFVEAAQQQAEQESVIKRQAQKIGELIADRDSWIEAHARLYRLYHDQSPKAGEEIHVNVEGGDVYTLPLQRSGMDKPRFVVHVPRPQQAEPGADERAAFEAWASKRRMDLRREANNPDEYLLASTADAFVGWQAHAAQSGQRAGVAELREIADNITANAVTQPKTNWGDGYRQACADIAGGLRLCANAAPTQQEGK